MHKAKKTAKVVRAHCNECLGEKNHELLHSEDTYWSAPVDELPGCSVDGGATYEMLKCLGCDRIILRHTTWFSEEPEERPVHYYPPAISRKVPDWVSDIETEAQDDTFIADIFNEVYVALQNNSRRLATMGIRALLEHIMIDKVGDHGRFRDNLNEFEKQGYVSKKQRKILETVLEVGHATMHRSYNPSQDQLNAAIDTTENLIQTIYVLESRAKKIKVPERKPRRSADTDT